MILITFSSSTMASKLKKLALSRGINDISIVQTPKEISGGGCSYAVKAHDSKLPELASVISEYGLRPNGIYSAEKNSDKKINYKRVR